jgi:hypothetical protein
MLRHSRRTFLALLGSTALAGAAAAESTTKAPITPALPADEATRDPALVRVRAACLQAAKAKDFRQLQPHLDPKIQLSFGGDAGIGQFRTKLAREAGLWEELVWVLENGGRFQQTEFTAPYTFTADTGNLEVEEAAVIVAEKVEARAEPRADAPVLATLGRQAIKVVDWKFSDKQPRPFYKRRDWVQVELADKRKAWIEARHVRSTIDYRAGFKKVRGVWRMNFFLAGD